MADSWADYLMFADLDYSHKEVQDDVKAWGPWVGKELGLKGFRFDAIKHYSESFLLDFVNHLDQNVGQGWFMVGEFWDLGIDGLTEYLEKMQHKFSLFDAPLVGNFHKISTGDKADMRSVFDETLVQCEPYNAVTLVSPPHDQYHRTCTLNISPPLPSASTTSLTPPPRSKTTTPNPAKPSNCKSPTGSSPTRTL